MIWPSLPSGVGIELGQSLGASIVACTAEPPTPVPSPGQGPMQHFDGLPKFDDGKVRYVRRRLGELILGSRAEAVVARTRLSRPVVHGHDP